MNRLKIVGLVVLLVGMFMPAFAFDGAQFAKVLQTAVNADEYLYSLMEPGMSKTSPEFQGALAAQKQTRTAVANEINALETSVELEQALAVAKKFSAQSGASANIGRLAESLIAKRLEFIAAHQN